MTGSDNSTSSISSLKIDKEKKYWNEKLKGYEKRFELPNSIDSRVSTEIKRLTYQFRFTEALSKKLNKLANNSEINAFLILLAGANLVLNKYTENDDIVMLLPISKQKNEGNYINTSYPLRTKMEQDFTGKELLINIKKSFLEANENINYPIKNIIDSQLNSGQYAENKTITDVAIYSNNIHDRKYLKEHETKVIINLHISEIISGEIEYNSNQFDISFMDKLIEHFNSITDSLISKLEGQISTIELITKEEKEFILNECNCNFHEFEKKQLIKEIFENQAKQNPNDLAIIFKDNKLTYSELNEKANTVANYLNKKGIKEDFIVGILSNPSVEMIVGIIAILKLGATFLPLSSDIPNARLEYILKDSNVDILLSDVKIEINNIQTILLNDSLEVNPENPLLNSVSDANAYVIYTSGTTGKPKGVIVKNSNLVNYVHWFSNKLSIDSASSTMLTSSYIFDLGYSTIFPILLNGGTLHLSSKEFYLNPNEFLTYVENNDICFLKLTPSHFNMLINNTNFDSTCFKNIETLVLGGEGIIIEDIEKLFQIYPKINVINHYGPTEATIGCISKIITKENFNDYKKQPTIGNPVNNTNVYIMDAHLQLRPMNMAGEICISGENVTKGYINNPELTFEKFRKLSFIEDVVYKTGDVGKLREDKEIVFSGRNDDQLKLNGFRVELREIEVVARNYPGIVLCVAIVEKDENHNNVLCLYYSVNEVFNEDAFKGYFFEQLPYYMVPAYFISCKEMPLTLNGKIDRKKLFRPKNEISKVAQPTNQIESKLLKLWSEIFKIDELKIGLGDSFFELGGNSLSAIMLQAKMLAEFNVKIDLVEIIQRSSLQDLAGLIAGKQVDKYVGVKLTEKKEYYQMSYDQERIYYVWLQNKDSIAYNIPRVYMLSGHVNEEKIKSIFSKLIRRHESLRTNFNIINNQAIQFINNKHKFEISEENVSGIDENIIIETFVRPFNLNEDSLIRIKIVKLGDGRVFLLIDTHHIIMDGVSSSILIREFAKLYNEKELPKLKYQFIDFVEWQSLKNVSDNQKDYWRKVLVGQKNELLLPFDYKVKPNSEYNGGAISFKIDGQKAQIIRNISKENDVSIFVVMFTLFNIFLSKISNQRDVLVSTPYVGRKNVEFNSIVGMFINTLLIKNQIDSKATFLELLNHVNKEVLNTFDNGDFPFHKILETLGLENNYKISNLFNIAFIFNNIDYSSQKVNEMNIKAINRESNNVKYKLSLYVYENEGFECVFKYDQSLFKKETVTIFIDFFMNIVQHVCENMNSLIEDVQFVSQENTSTSNIENFGFNL